MITLKLSPDTRWHEVSTRLGTVWHYDNHAVAASIHQDFQSTLATRRYMCGLEQPNYPMPAIIECEWCGSRNETCNYNGYGYWCPSLCFILN